MDPALVEAMKSMTPEQAKAFMEQMTPEQKLQMQRMQEGMFDLKHLVEKMKPPEDDPDRPVSLLTVVKALCSAPLMNRTPHSEEEKAAMLAAVAECTDDVLASIEKACVEAGSLEAGSLDGCEEVEKRNVLLLYYHMHQTKYPELGKTLNQGVDQMRMYVNSLATKLLVKAQMLMPQQRWVQPTLAIASASALVSNALWSHTDEEAISAMRGILQEDQLPYPKLSLNATCGPKNTAENADECTAGQAVSVKVILNREHAAPPADGQEPNNPQGIYEAYWLYVEGLKEGQPNSLIAAQPMVVKDLEEAVVEAEKDFQAPPKPGTYTLRVHVVSTSVIGIHHTKDVSFTVVEDDVPALE